MFKISPFLSVFYPESCKSCQDILVKGESFVCLHCELNFGEVMHTEYAFSEVDQLFWGKARIESAVAVFQFLKQEKLQSIIHEFKYKGNAGLAVRMGEIIGHNSDLLSQDIDAVSFVPMHPEKEKKKRL
ncbi:MAG: hypothetical protein CMP63_08140 [Flavobacteriales bacterium]|nr:hypothetical protein [Flavobacteriales bacterium]